MNTDSKKTETEQCTIPSVMQRAVDYYKYIDKIGEELSNMCLTQIKPLLDDGKYKEAKKAVNKFYEPSKIDDFIIFIERDMIMAKINRLIKDVA